MDNKLCPLKNTKFCICATYSEKGILHWICFWTESFVFWRLTKRTRLRSPFLRSALGTSVSTCRRGGRGQAVPPASSQRRSGHSGLPGDLCVCVRVCACVYIHVSVYMHVCACVCYVYVSIMCMHVCMYVYTCDCVYACMYVYVWVCMCVHVSVVSVCLCVCEHVCVYACVSVCMYVCVLPHLKHVSLLTTISSSCLWQNAHTLI